MITYDLFTFGKTILPVKENKISKGPGYTLQIEPMNLERTDSNFFFFHLRVESLWFICHLLRYFRGNLVSLVLDKHQPPEEREQYECVYINAFYKEYG